MDTRNVVNDCRCVIPSPRKSDRCEISVNETKILPVIHGGAAKSGWLTRREMVQRLLAGVGAGAVWPLVAAGHPIHEHLANGAIFEEAEKLGAADWKPLFLRGEQNEALVALSEGIVPGSIKAQVNRFIDLLLSVDTTEHQQKFAESLEAFDAEARGKINEFPTTTSRTRKGGSAGCIIRRKRGCESWAGTENMYSKVFQAANIRTGMTERIDERISQSQKISSRCRACGG